MKQRYVDRQGETWQDSSIFFFSGIQGAWKRGRGDKETRRQGDKGKRRRGEEGKRGRGEEEKRGRGEEEKRGRGEALK